MVATIAALALTAAVGQARAPSTVPLRISITSRAGLVVDVVIENLSAKDLDLPVSASFVLGREGKSFWAPLDTMIGVSHQGAVRVAPGRPIAPQPKPARIKLAAHQSHRIRIELDQLNWARTISSVWPEQPLRVVVPSGQYALVLEISADGSNAAARSNKVTVHVAQ